MDDALQGVVQVEQAHAGGLRIAPQGGDLLAAFRVGDVRQAVCRGRYVVILHGDVARR
ncbi:hypothetical protein D3C85_1502630 [compost metagenome]